MLLEFLKKKRPSNYNNLKNGVLQRHNDSILSGLQFDVAHVVLVVNLTDQRFSEISKLLQLEVKISCFFLDPHCILEDYRNSYNKKISFLGSLFHVKIN